MEKITIENFQDDFDNYIKRVECGESFIINDKSGNSVAVIPTDEDVIRIHTDHNDAC